MIRPGLGITASAVALAVLTAVVIGITATVGRTAVGPFIGAALVLHGWFLVIGSSRWVGIASIPILGTIMIEAGLGDEPSWIRSIIVGVLWFVTMEVSWEAIDRRSGAVHSPVATRQRIQEVVAVAGIAIAVGVLASAATSFAPVRSVLLQALVLAAVFLGFVSLIRQVRAS